MLNRLWNKIKTQMSPARQKVLDLLGPSDGVIVLTRRALARTIKAKYPCYSDLSDLALTESFLRAYPKYAGRVIN